MDPHHTREAIKEFNLIFSGLRSKGEEERLRHALALKNILFNGGTAVETNSWLSESFVYNRLHEITVSKNDKQKIEVYYAIKEFVRLVGGPEMETSRIARLLDSLMNIKTITRDVANTLGLLYKPGWSLVATYFSFTCGNAIENLGSKIEGKKLNSLLLLESLARHNPGASYPYIETIFGGLYQTLKDPSLEIREDSYQLLYRCLQILYDRDQYIHLSRFNALYEEAIANLKSSSSESIHSSFLIFKALLHITILSNHNKSLAPLDAGGNKNAISFASLTDKVDDMFNKCWLFNDYKSSTVRIEIVEVLPLIAKFNPRIFTLKYLQNIQDFYMVRLRKDKDRVAALYLFGSISREIGAVNCLLYAKNLISVIEYLIYSLNSGDLDSSNALSSGSGFTDKAQSQTDYLNGLEEANASLNAHANGFKQNEENKVADPVILVSDCKGLKRYELERAMFYAIMKICQTLGPKITQVLTLNLIDLVITKCNITKPFEALMKVLIDEYPNLEIFILKKLLNKISLFLGGCEYIEPGVSITSLNLSSRDKKRLKERSVIGIHFDEYNGRVFLDKSAKTNVNGSISENRSSELRKMVNLYKQPYNVASAPLSNYNFKDLSSNFNNFTAVHEGHSLSNHTNAGGTVSREDEGSHFITIKDLVDLTKAKNCREAILRDYGFSMQASGSFSNVSSTVSAKVSAISDSYFSKLIEGSEKVETNDNFEFQATQMLVECFTILSRFYFSSNFSLFEFARYVTLSYIDSENPQIRKIAAITSEQLFSKDEIMNTIQIGSITAVSEVLSKLLLVGITDPISELRLDILKSLSSKFDPQLAQSDNVRLLLMSLNDESFDVRKVSIQILGRISSKNPAYIIPALRKILIQYLNDLKYGTVNSSRENSCSLLSTLISCATMLTKPHIDAIVEVLMPLIGNNINSAICSIAVRCLGELARVSGDATKEFLDKVIPLILEILMANSLSISTKEKVIAVRTLCQLIRSSGDVIEPLFQYPDLLHIITSFVSVSNSDSNLKRETIKLQGILGALDPYKVRSIESNNKSLRQNKTKNQLLLTEQKKRTQKLQEEQELDISNYCDNAKFWGHQEAGKDFDSAVDLNEFLSITDASSRIPKLIQLETSVDLLLLMQLNVELRPSAVSEDYYLIVVLVTLIKVLKDLNANSHHETVMAIIVEIFARTRDKCLPFTKHVLSGMIRAMKNYTASKVKQVFQQIRSIVQYVDKYIRASVPLILECVIEHFESTDKTTLIDLVSVIAKNLESEFKVYLPMLLSLFLRAMNNDTTRDASISKQIIRAFLAFGVSIEEYANLIVTNILGFIEQGPVELRRIAIESIGKFTTVITLTDLGSRIIHAFLRVLQSKSPDSIQLRDGIMSSLCALIVQLKSEYFIFLPLVDRVLTENRIGSASYTKIVHQLIKNENVSFTLPAEYEPDPGDRKDAAMRPLKAKELQAAWQPYHCKNKGDWIEWLKKFNLVLLEYSPSIALNCCLVLAYAHVPVARELFNTAFVCCWLALSDDLKADLSKCIYYVLHSSPGSSDALQAVLNLCEYMEHNNTRLPIGISVLSRYSFRHHAYAKALHYKELEFKESVVQHNVTEATVDSLIKFNNSLQQSDAGIGILKVATDTYKFTPKESWYQKLQRWKEALSIYEVKIEASLADVDVINGKMSCLHALGQWEQLEKFSESTWNHMSNTNKEKVAPLAAAAAWGTSKWGRMDDYINVMKEDSANKYFFESILSVHRCNYGAAKQNIKNARELLSGEISSLINESYSRAYDVVVRIQMLSDIEEIIEYKQLDGNSPRKAHLRAAWDKRLFNCQGNVDIWQRLLNIRSLVIPPEEDLEARIKFANLCRKSGRIALAEKTLSSLKRNVIQLLPAPGNGNKGGSFTSPALVYAQLKLLWNINQKEKAFNTICTFTYDLSASLCLRGDSLPTPELPEVLPCDIELYLNLRKILCKCFLKQGQWHMQLNPDWSLDKEQAEGAVLGSFLIPTILNDEWYKGWHNWALANFEVVKRKSPRMRGNNDEAVEEKETDKEDDTLAENELIKLHVNPAIKGFFRAIQLSNTIALQDLLRLLDIWFHFGGFPEAALSIDRGINQLSLETWLQVLPQLLSRLHHENPVINNSLQKLIVRLAELHPQALLFPLNVSVRSDKKAGQSVAKVILNNVKLLHAELVNEADIIVTQLVKVAMLINEQWYQRIEEAVTVFQSGYHYEKMIDMLDEVYNAPRTTFFEKAFWATWSNDLTEGHQWLVKYKVKLQETGKRDTSLLQLAFDTFAPIHNRLASEFSLMKSHDLEYIAPVLLECHDLQLAMPGTYEPRKAIIRIAEFEGHVPVITSKQRPRRIFIKGHDGRLYDYALKGQEDIRQDNMVMQLFGLVNRLLANDPECSNRHLNVQPYPTVPLSPRSGLLGWVPNSDTFHQLISQNRSFKGTTRDIERRAHSQFSSKHFEFSTFLRKVETFLLTLTASRGMDIYEVLWLKSRSSEVWLERRATYVRSLALMSMVGYILGLGDRHPSNIMINRITGKVIHIDFGDCFEAASLREKWPEKVPFRLTRMLVNGLEASGIEGSYRITLDNVVRVLRSNSESLLALFDSFAYDPLINWGFDIPTKAVVRATGYKPPDPHPGELLAKGQIDSEEYEKLAAKEKHDEHEARAQYVLRRIDDKLKGNDFAKARNLSIDKQIDRLISEATSNENLALHFIGWCPFW